MTDQQDFKRSVQCLQKMMGTGVATLNAEAMNLGVQIYSPGAGPISDFMQRLWEAKTARKDYDRAHASLSLASSLTQGRAVPERVFSRHLAVAMADIAIEDQRADEEFLTLLKDL